MHGEGDAVYEGHWLGCAGAHTHRTSTNVDRSDFHDVRPVSVSMTLSCIWPGIETTNQARLVACRWAAACCGPRTARTASTKRDLSFCCW